jgi:uncharacterized membrane protein
MDLFGALGISFRTAYSNIFSNNNLFSQIGIIFSGITITSSTIKKLVELKQDYELGIEDRFYLIKYLSYMLQYSAGTAMYVAGTWNYILKDDITESEMGLNVLILLTILPAVMEYFRYLDDCRQPYEDDYADATFLAKCITAAYAVSSSVATYITQDQQSANNVRIAATMAYPTALCFSHIYDSDGDKSDVALMSESLIASVAVGALIGVTETAANYLAVKP